MPTPPQLPDDRHKHVEQWKHNRAFAATIEAQYHDWIVTVLFYAALHAVDASLCHDAIRVETHRTRSVALLTNRRYEQIRKHYEPFYKLSRTSRYMADPRTWVRYEDIEAEVLRRYLYPIEKSVRKLTGIEIDYSPISLRPRSS